MSDPTLEEILAALDNPSDDDADVYCAIYWFANDWHSGQWSNLYSVLSTSPYRPGMCERGPDGYAQEHYDTLVTTFSVPAKQPA
jgi:hypothetical protein